MTETQWGLDKLQDLEEVEYQPLLWHGPLNRSERQFYGRHRVSLERRPAQKRLFAKKAIVKATVHYSFKHRSHLAYALNGRCDYHDYYDDYDGALMSDDHEVMGHNSMEAEQDIVKATSAKQIMVTTKVLARQVMVTAVEALVDMVMATARAKDSTEGQMDLDTQGSSLLHRRIHQAQHL